MKTVLSTFSLSLLALAVGCTERTPGGPGANRATPGTNSPTTVNRPIYGEAEKTFTLSVPILTTTLKQGETKSETISLDRGKDFQEDVTVQLTGLPQGVSVEPANLMIRHGDKEGTVNIHAANDAALGDFTIKAVGHPTQGSDAMTEFKLTVKENK